MFWMQSLTRMVCCPSPPLRSTTVGALHQALREGDEGCDVFLRKGACNPFCGHPVLFQTVVLWGMGRG